MCICLTLINLMGIIFILFNVAFMFSASIIRIEVFLIGCSNLLISQLFHLNRYLSEQKLPLEMLELQKGCTANDCNNVSGEDGGCTDSGEDCLNNKGTWTGMENVATFPYEVGDLQIISLGNFSRLLAFYVLVNFFM